MAPDSACHAGGRGSESRRSRSGSALNRALRPLFGFAGRFDVRRNQVGGARSLYNQRSQRSTHEHPLDHPDRRPCARPTWLFRTRPLLATSLRHACTLGRSALCRTAQVGRSCSGGRCDPDVLERADRTAELPRLGGMATPDGVAIVSEEHWAFARVDGGTQVFIICTDRATAAARTGLATHGRSGQSGQASANDCLHPVRPCFALVEPFARLEVKDEGPP